MDSLTRHEHGAYRVWTRPGVELEPVLAAIRTQGDVLKTSPKATTSRTGDWVVKRSAARPRLMIKQAFAGQRRRQAFDAALYLEEHNIPAPRAVAYAERRLAGLVVQTWVLTTFLEACVDVEAFLDRMIENNADSIAIDAFFSRLAESFNTLVDSGAQHQDLAGKNILTRDGATFHFIDLDAIAIGKPYTADDRFKNHVQLYDSFCDKVGDDHLEAFLLQMRPETRNIALHMTAVKEVQVQRRARTEAIWRKEGRL